MEFVTLPLWIGKNYSKGIATFDTEEFNALHLAEFFPVDSWTVFEISVVVKKFRKELGNDDHYYGWTGVGTKRRPKT